MNEVQKERLKRVGRVANTLRLVQEEGLKLDDEALIKEIILQWGVTRRTAQEYIYTAKLNLTRVEDDGKKIAKNKSEMQLNLGSA